MKFITRKNVIQRGKIVPAGQLIELDRRAKSTEALYESGHIVPEEELNPSSKSQGPQKPGDSTPPPPPPPPPPAS